MKRRTSSKGTYLSFCLITKFVFFKEIWYNSTNEKEKEEMQ